ncbi:MAG TPA: ATP-binding protein [Actinomycetota bacterium]|nr:ATP-binding protein [Actinomycetota bacterium]
MNIVFSLNLPKDEASVPVVRRISREALLGLGVRDDCVADIEVALSEACTNVLKHVAGTDEAYEVKVEVNESLCEIRVIDTGTGFDHDSAGRAHAEHTAEGGRGVFLMRAMVDNIEFTSAPESGTMVHLTKKLGLTQDSVLAKPIAGAAN